MAAILPRTTPTAAALLLRSTPHRGAGHLARFLGGVSTACSSAGDAAVEFLRWHNGGGILHRAASVDPSAVVEAGAVVHSGAVLGKEVVVGSGAVVGPSVSIGQSTRIGYNVSLSNCSVGEHCNVEDLLPNLSKLVHLRYLRIERGIYGKSSLPGTISRLYQLKIVDAQGCCWNSKLPRDINNLQNLQYFLVSDYSSLPSKIVEVGKLEHLRQLRRFEVKKRNDDSSKKRKTDGFELKQLGKMQELQVLGIYNLGNVTVKEEASEVNLIQKDQLQELTLDWDIEGIKQPTQEDDILECLKPHSSLQKLCIKGHGGAKCPTWLGVNLSVQHLEYLCLDDVAWEDLPSLDGLHMLKESDETRPSQKFMNLRMLELVNVQNLKKWVGIGSCHLFSHLEVLIIKSCKELSELSFLDPTFHQLEKAGNMDLFSSLKKLEIEDCPILSHLPSVPWTRSPCYAKIQKVDSCFEAINYTDDFELEIEGKDGALDSTFWKVLDFDNLTGLKELRT